MAEVINMWVTHNIILTTCCIAKASQKIFFAYKNNENFFVTKQQSQFINIMNSDFAIFH